MECSHSKVTELTLFIRDRSQKQQKSGVPGKPHTEDLGNYSKLVRTFVCMPMSVCDYVRGCLQRSEESVDLLKLE